MCPTEEPLLHRFSLPSLCSGARARSKAGPAPAAPRRGLEVCSVSSWSLRLRSPGLGCEQGHVFSWCLAAVFARPSRHTQRCTIAVFAEQIGLHQQNSPSPRYSRKRPNSEGQGLELLNRAVHFAL